MKRCYHWISAGTALFTLFVSNGITIGGLSVFDEDLLRTFGWSRGALKFRDLLTLAIAGLISPAAGALADRYGVRPLMALGALLLPVGTFIYSGIGAVEHMYGIHVLFPVALANCGLVMAVRLVSRWFIEKRGTALGITLVGTSLGGFIMPQVRAWLIAERGWRGAFVADGLLPIALLLVIVFFTRERRAGRFKAPWRMRFGDSVDQRQRRRCPPAAAPRRAAAPRIGAWVFRFCLSARPLICNRSGALEAGSKM